jgi:hypothetical protein
VAILRANEVREDAAAEMGAEGGVGIDGGRMEGVVVEGGRRRSKGCHLLSFEPVGSLEGGGEITSKCKQECKKRESIEIK